MRARSWAIGHLVIWSVLTLTARASAQTPKLPTAPTVHTSLDRTAVWVADRINFRVDVVCPRGVDILEDDLSKDKLKLDGLDLVGSESSRSTDAAETTTHTFTYVLTTYRVDMPVLKIGQLPVRYYIKRPGQRLQDEAPAGSVDVGGEVIAFRSTMADNQDFYPLRDRRPAAARAQLFSLAQPIGLGLVVASIVPVAIWGVAFVASRRKPGIKRSVRQVRHEERASLDAVRSMNMETLDGRRDAFTQIDAVVREHLRDVVGVPGPSLTPEEIEPALSGKSTRVPAEDVASLLATCEVARYAPPESMPSADACRQALDRAADLLNAT